MIGRMSNKKNLNIKYVPTKIYFSNYIHAEKFFI